MMLHLAAPTSQGWVEQALGHMDLILLDHAHCEKKAASTAVKLIFRYQDRPELMAPLSALAREELEHFEHVLQLLEERGIPFRRLAPPPYARDLYAAIRSDEPQRLLDTLIVCALIEARSCERMRLLSETLTDPELADLYRGLLASEGRHFGEYLGLAQQLFDPDTVWARHRELAEHEAEILATLHSEPRMHS